MKIFVFKGKKNKIKSKIGKVESLKKQSKKAKVFINVVSNFAIAIMLLFVGLVTLDFNSINVFSKNEFEAIYYGNKDSSYVSLMINVYWGTEYLDDMLNTLNSHNVKCTFFVGGTWAEKETEILEKIYDNGHEISSHGYFHKDQKYLNYDQNYTEIYSTHQLIKTLLNIDMNLFAPPSGSFNNATLQAANELGYKTIMWTKDTIDWRDKDTDLITKRATVNVQGGDFILMHPTYNTSLALEQILDYYENNNLIATTVTKNLKS